jgi:CHAT domain-containing protein
MKGKLTCPSHSFHLPPLSDVVSASSDQPKKSQPTYSAHLFWQWYMKCIDKDMKKKNRSSLAATCCRRFLDEMQQCTMPEMKYIFMTVVAEYYEQSGDTSQVLQWRQKANVVAQDIEDEEIRQEAERAFRLALADKAVIALDDPYGIKQAEWAVAQKADLEHLFCEARERNDWYRQFEYAWKLLEKELDEELCHGRSPCGKQWHSKLDEILKHLDNEKQLHERPRVAFTVAHAKFEAGDFHGCTSTFREVVNESLATGNKETASRALFTTSRAYLELFRTSKDNADWDKAEAALLGCQALCEEEEHFDVLACCHTVHAMLWHARRADREDALTKSLECITDAQRIWSTERLTVMGIAELDTLLTHYAMTGRNAKTPYSIYGLAVEICFELGRYDEAYQWAECGKAQAFHGGLKSNDLPMKLNTAAVPGQEELLPPTLEEPALLVHWVINGETIYICACRNAHEYFVFKLGITTSAVEEWHQNIVATKDDLSEAEAAEEMLSELEPLCRPLVENQSARPGDLLVLCPTSVLFKIPIHAIPLSDGSTLLERHPIVYTHSFSVLKTCLARRQRRHERTHKRSTIMGNATGDTPAGETSVHKIATQLNAHSFTRQHATKDRFVDRAPTSQLIHMHGHVSLDAYPLDQSMLFHHGEPLRAREVFNFHLAASHPLVVLIGCGSGVERLDAGDEPLGLISGFLYAGASAVVATMWPIHDRLAGAAFSEDFYDWNVSSDPGGIDKGQMVDLARRLQRAALSIKAKEETKAPYFWAGFVVHGDWRVVY